MSDKKAKPTLASKLLEMKDRFHIFKDMNDADILSIVKNISFRKYNAGEIIVREGEVGLDIFYLISGQCNVIANRAIVGSLSSGSLFGEVAAFMQSKRTATIRSVSDTKMVAFQIDYDLTDKFPAPFAKYYKNMTIDLIKKIELANQRKK